MVLSLVLFRIQANYSNANIHVFVFLIKLHSGDQNYQLQKQTPEIIALNTNRILRKI